ncbi:uncharacterized protein Tco025E_05871 [Trypanosoma conorhini]|uniref:Uncharacterized protein n=1 Tax=Trypanosoma conorhini TaxID=83891 RepID=A0A3R7KSR5_9TRYP|nr:uncharacterized protein Tco025E_05871 [Trypanosoma conorhini]RNF14614.1 hypothetical protein Tco025E_05871 [Trypanosoma conorhini]
MNGAGSSGNHIATTDSPTITKWSLIILVVLGSLALSIFVACVWFNFHWTRRIMGGLSIGLPFSQSRSVVAGNGVPRQVQAQGGENEQETLRGHALENRVRVRRHQGPQSYHLPDGHTTVYVDDFSRLPEAKPPPPTEEEMQQRREEAERVPSPVFYGRGSYLRRSMSSLFGSFRLQTTPRTPAAASVGSRVFSSPSRRDDRRGHGDSTSRRPNEPTNTSLSGVDPSKLDKPL